MGGEPVLTWQVATREDLWRLELSILSANTRELVVRRRRISSTLTAGYRMERKGEQRCSSLDKEVSVMEA
jgi:hypothetical protein